MSSGGQLITHVTALLYKLCRYNCISFVWAISIWEHLGFCLGIQHRQALAKDAGFCIRIPSTYPYLHTTQRALLFSLTDSHTPPPWPHKYLTSHIESFFCLAFWRGALTREPNVLISFWVRGGICILQIHLVCEIPVCACSPRDLFAASSANDLSNKTPHFSWHSVSPKSLASAPRSGAPRSQI